MVTDISSITGDHCPILNNVVDACVMEKNNGGVSKKYKKKKKKTPANLKKLQQATLKVVTDLVDVQNKAAVEGKKVCTGTLEELINIATVQLVYHQVASKRKPFILAFVETTLQVLLTRNSCLFVKSNRWS
jgi:uncharacterized protein YrrD